MTAEGIMAGLYIQIALGYGFQNMARGAGMFELFFGTAFWPVALGALICRKCSE